MSKALCSLISAGCAKYGRRENLTGQELFDEALDEAFANCHKLERKRINAVYLGQAFESFEHKANSAASFANNYGISGVPTLRVESVSSSGGSALRQGVLGILSGAFDVVLCGGFEKMTTKNTEEALEIISMAADRPYEQWNGVTLTSLNALAAREHMQKYGTTEEQMALVAVKNHQNAFENSKAYLHKIISVEEVLASRKISTPLKLLDCSPICDGASCIVLCKPEIAKEFTDAPIDVIGTGEASDSEFVYRDEFTGFSATRKAAHDALSKADRRVEDMDLIEIHDAFTINELIGYEDLGLCVKGDGGKLIESGATKRDGRNPVNTSGGLKAKGHPVGSSGIGQVYEVYSQLTEKSEPARRVKGARTALTHSMGGAGVTVQVHVFQTR